MNTDRLFYVKEGHPLGNGEYLCPRCHLSFWAGQWAWKHPLEAPDPFEWRYEHATCALKGRRIRVTVGTLAGEEATIERIVDGDASPYPVRAIGAHGIPLQFKFTEIEEL